MYNHPIRKFAGLIVLYSIIIIGIFVLQFRSESAFSRNIGLLRVSLEQNVDDKGNTTLLNTVKASFKGITFTADDNTPAILKLYSGETKNLKLTSWEQYETGFKFNFTDNVVLNFAVTKTGSDGSLNVNALIPSNASSLLLSYKPDSSFTVTENSPALALFEGKGLSYKLTSSSLENDYVVLTAASPVFAYTFQEPPKQAKPKATETRNFTYAQLPKSASTATRETYVSNTNTFRSNFLTQASAAIAAGTIPSEAVIAAYVAEMGASNRYTEAVNAIPESYRKGTDRTYLTAPFFNSLVAMNPSLVKENDSLSLSIRNAVTDHTLDVFTNPGVAQFMLRNPTNENVISLSKMCAGLQEFEPNLAQASGIINTYAVLKNGKSSNAENMTPVIAKCIEIITACSKLSGDSLSLKENDAVVSFTQTIKTASSLIAYGSSVADNDCITAGYMIANTSLAQNPTASLEVASSLYPYIASGNTYYPHFLIAGHSPSETVWSWTCAENITYIENEEHTECTISIDFGLGDSHYIILRGIKPFSGIEIYGIPFHTDARFETYNSSGYVYNENNHTLYLKSRHKSANEIVHLTFRKKAPAAETPAPKPAEPEAPSETVSPVSTEYTPIPETEE